MLFTRTKSDKNLPTTRVSNIQISYVLKKQYPGKIRCLNTTPESSDVGIPRILSHSNQNNEVNASIVKMTRGLTRVHTSCCLALSIACSYFLNFLRQNIRNPIGRYVSLMNFIG